MDPLSPPISIKIQDIEGPRRSIIPQEVRNVEPLEASIKRIYYKHRDPIPDWSEIIGSKFTNKYSTDIYVHGWMNYASDTILSESPNFMGFGMLSVEIMNELRSVFSPTTRIGAVVHGYNWLPRSHCISEATADRMSGTESKLFLKLRETKW